MNAQTPVTNPVPNPTPKARFLQVGIACSQHRAMIDSDAFQSAADFAMLEYAARLATVTEPEKSSVMALKIQGAHEFLQTMRNLAEPATRITPKIVTPNLTQS